MGPRAPLLGMRMREKKRQLVGMLDPGSEEGAGLVGPQSQRRPASPVTPLSCSCTQITLLCNQEPSMACLLLCPPAPRALW